MVGLLKLPSLFTATSTSVVRGRPRGASTTSVSSVKRKPTLAQTATITSATSVAPATTATSLAQVPATTATASPPPAHTATVALVPSTTVVSTPAPAAVSESSARKRRASSELKSTTVAVSTDSGITAASAKNAAIATVSSNSSPKLKPTASTPAVSAVKQEATQVVPKPEVLVSIPEHSSISSSSGSDSSDSADSDSSDSSTSISDFGSDDSDSEHEGEMTDTMALAVLPAKVQAGPTTLPAVLPAKVQAGPTTTVAVAEAVSNVAESEPTTTTAMVVSESTETPAPAEAGQMDIETQLLTQVSEATEITTASPEIIPTTTVPSILTSQFVSDAVDNTQTGETSDSDSDSGTGSSSSGSSSDSADSDSSDSDTESSSVAARLSLPNLMAFSAAKPPSALQVLISLIVYNYINLFTSVFIVLSISYYFI